MTIPKVTVLTAVRNGADYLGETITSIQAQTFTDWEYIIVDDASTDETVAIVERAMQSDRRLRLLRRETAGGPYTAANQGIQEACGKYIVRTDADDLSPRDRIAKQYAFLEQNRRLRACVSFWQAYDGAKLIPGTIAPVPVDQDVFCWYLLLRGPSLHSSVCYQRDAILEIGGYRELPLSQDYRLWCELTRRRWLGIMPQVLSFVRMHQKRVSMQKRELQRNLALDILEDHLTALTGETWSREDLNALWTVGHSDPMPVRKGLEMLDRWDQLWKSAHLNSEQTRELRRLSAFRRWKHLRGNARRQPAQAVLGSLQCGFSLWKAMLPPPVHCEGESVL